MVKTWSDFFFLWKIRPLTRGWMPRASCWVYVSLESFTMQFLNNIALVPIIGKLSLAWEQLSPKSDIVEYSLMVLLAYQIFTCSNKNITFFRVLTSFLPHTLGQKGKKSVKLFDGIQGSVLLNIAQICSDLLSLAQTCTFCSVGISFSKFIVYHNFFGFLIVIATVWPLKKIIIG